MIPSFAHPLISPILHISAWIIGVGAVFATVMGVLRLTDKATYREDWIRLGILIGQGLVILIVGAFGRWALLPAVVVIAFVGWFEMMRGVGHRDGSTFWLYPVLGALGVVGGVWGTSFAALTSVGVAAWMAIVLPMVISRRPVPLSDMLGAAFGTVLISIPLTHLLLLVQLDYGAFALLIIVVNCHDGFAVGFGRLLGRTPLCEHISPKKTWEGAGGGLAICLAIAYAARFLVPEWALWQVLSGAGSIVLFSLLGDLVASSLKREVGIKDFGSSFPGGMGGFLDRYDGLLFSVPVFYIFVRLMVVG